MKIKPFHSWPEWSIVFITHCGLILFAGIVYIAIRSVEYVFSNSSWTEQDTRALIIFIFWFTPLAIISILAIKEKGAGDE